MGFLLAPTGTFSPKRKMNFAQRREQVLTRPPLTHCSRASYSASKSRFAQLQKKDNICKALRILLGKKQSDEKRGLLVLSRINSLILALLTRQTNEKENPDHLLDPVARSFPCPVSQSAPLDL